MVRYITRKALYGLLVMFGVVVVVFFLFQGFGDPARLTMGQSGDSATIQNIRRELYLDQPLMKQFGYYLRDVSPVAIHAADEIRNKQLRGVFIGRENKVGIKLPYLGRSYQTRRPVWDVLMEALPGTMLLALAAIMLAICIGIPLGVIAAVKRDTWMDTTAIFTSILGISAPSFFMGIVIAYIFGFVLSDYTGLAMTGSLYETDPFTGRTLSIRNLVLPAITLGIRPLAIITQLTRSAMLDVLNQDYIRTAYTKRPGQENDRMETCTSKCTQSCNHCYYRVVCRTACRGIFCGIYFWLEGHRESDR